MSDLAAEFEHKIQAELASLTQASEATDDDRRPVTLDQQSVGRLSRMDAMQGQAMAAAVEARRSGRRRALEAALLRIEEGEYGYCLDCGGEIGAARLTVDPCAPKCISCARG